MNIVLHGVMLSFVFQHVITGLAYAERDVFDLGGGDCSVEERLKLIRQKNIPYTIKKPGEYRLAETVKYHGPGAAITIHADDVKLNLDSSSIILTSSSATGILVHDVSKFVIEGGAIVNEHVGAQSGFGIHILNAAHGLIKNVLTSYHLDGLLVENSHDIHAGASQFWRAEGAGAAVLKSTNITFDASLFADSGNGLIFSSTNTDCQVLNSEFPSSTFSNLYVQQINGLLVRGCLFNNGAGNPSKANLIQLGDALPAQTCNDVIIKECTIINRPAHSPVLGNTSPEGIGIYQGSGFVVEECMIDTDNTNQDPAADLSGIHVSNPGLGSGTIASNVVIRLCVVQGPATNGLYPDIGSSGVVIEECLTTGAQKNGIFLAGTTASMVRNNIVVNNGTNGIFLGETSVGNAVSGNVVSSNGFILTSTSLPPAGNGISIALDSTKNLIQRNEVFNNAVDGISDQGTGNQIYYNTAYGNGAQNYNAATDTIIVSHPGDPARAAENIAP